MPPATDGSWLTALVDWCVSLMETVGPAGAGAAIALESIFPPIPSEVVLPMAGLTASRGGFTFVEALAWTTLGSIVGALALYGLGALLGVDRLRRIAAVVPLLHPSDIDKTVAWFDKHGSAAVFFGRMLPLFRSFISIPAGVTRMPLLRFAALSAAGSLIWNAIFVSAGFFLGEQWHIVERYTEVLQYLVIAAIIAAVGWFIVSRVRAARRRSREDALASQPAPN